MEGCVVDKQPDSSLTKSYSMNKASFNRSVLLVSLDNAVGKERSLGRF